MRIRMRDLVNPGSEMEEIGTGILDKHPGSAKMLGTDHPFLGYTKYRTGNNPLRKNMYLFTYNDYRA
jgi:hypothetical protein